MRRSILSQYPGTACVITAVHPGYARFGPAFAGICPPYACAAGNFAPFENVADGWGAVMSVHASHQGIPYELTELREGEWQWAFTPPGGARRTGPVRGSFPFAVSVTQRGIEVWRLMNRGERTEAA